MASNSIHHPSPGNAFNPRIPPMRMPHLDFLYRLVAEMHPTDHYELPNQQGTGVSRSIAHILRGTIDGPRIKGKLVENSGADWAQRIHSKNIFYRLDARYTVLTNDGHHIFIQAKGIFRPGPIRDFVYDPEHKTSYAQNEVEYFTHLTFETAEGPYNWMNGIVAIGVMSSFEGQACVDAYSLTNFPGQEVPDVMVGK